MLILDLTQSVRAKARTAPMGRHSVPARLARLGLRPECRRCAQMSVGISTERPDFVSRFRRPGDYGGVAAPDPIPNSAVKRPCADGTSS